MKTDSINSVQSHREQSGVSRREVLSAASLIALGLAGGPALPGAVSPAEGAETHANPQHDSLEDFIFDIEHAPGGWRGDGGSATEATVEEFPISQSIAGVSMRLNPGGFRELHWHAIAAEWAYILEGRVRTTVITPEGSVATDEFSVGDIWYFPKGHGHMLQCVGNEPCHFLLAFDSGHFSEFGTFSVTDWISHTEPETVARNLNLPASAIRGLAKKELYIGTGAIAGDRPLPNINPHAEQSQNPHKFSLRQAVPKEFAGGSLRVVSQKEFPINATLTSALMVLKPGALREMHWHPNADEWQYVMSGTGRVTLFGSHGRVKTMDYNQGKIAFIKQGYGHYIENTGNDDLNVLILFNSPSYQEISLSSWLAGNPAQVVADHFGFTPEILANLPKGSAGILGLE